MYAVTIHRDLCKSCGLCIEFCPRKLLALDEGLNKRGVHPAVFTGSADACTGCCNCATMCPDAAIEIEEDLAAVESGPPEQGLAEE